MAPAVANETAEQPAKLQRYELEPGVVLKLTPEQYRAEKARRDQAEANRAAWERVAAGEAGPASEQTLEQGGVLLTVLTKAELVELAEKRGLKTSGSKDAIAARFAPDAEPDDDDDEDEGGDAD